MQYGKSMRALVQLIVILVWSGSSLAAFTGPYKMTFASSDPVAAQAFSEK